MSQVMNGPAARFTSCQAAADHIFSQVGKQLRLATPLGIGKPIELLNILYSQVSLQPDYSLEIYTALSLLPPQPKSDLERRFLGPFLKRHFGENTPTLHYAEAMRRGGLPGNIRVHEFYYQAGEYLGRREAQSQYVSINYTHVAKSLFERGVNVIVQVLSRNPKDPSEFSLSCNPDVTLDLIDLYRKSDKPLLKIGVIHPGLPFVGGDAVVNENFFDGIVEDPGVSKEIFALPRAPLEPADHLIGFYSSQMLPDDGTLQIGIGSLSEGIVHSLLLRQQKNSAYREIESQLWKNRQRPRDTELFNGVFAKGIYGTSELITDGFMHLREAGILTRLIFDADEHKRRYLHGAFFLGSKVFYQWLRDLKSADFSGFSMTRVSKVNDLYDPHELAIRRQRKNARFYNSCMKVTLLGGAVSDTLENGEVVSGVGGQYNFVAMSHELDNAHSVMMLRSTRVKNGRRSSNIVFNHSHLTIPRHLRDIVVTEYGIACLRGKSDEEVICALIEIADAEFQEELVATSKQNGKLSLNYRIPEWARMNTAASISNLVEKRRDLFPEYPFGSDFSAEELRLVGALRGLAHASNRMRLNIFFKGVTSSNALYLPELKRMELWKIKGVYQWLMKTLVTGALAAADKN